MKPTLNKPLIKQAVVAAQANRRQGTSHVKTRGEVSGGGKKPWRQKGTGRARAGSSRSPVWVGGGIVFGPRKERNHKLAFPKKMARMALDQLLNYFKDNDQLTVVASLALKEVKTKLAIKLLTDNAAEGKKTTLVTAEIQPELVLSMRNIPGVKVVENRNLSILDVAQVQLILIDKAAAESRGLLVKEAKPKAPAKTPKAK